MTSEGFLEWSLWRHNVSVYREASWMFCKFSDATNTVTKDITTNPIYPNPNPNPNAQLHPTNQTARTCVPRFRKRQQCATLQCSQGGVDCVCPMTQQAPWCGGRCVDA